MKVKCKYNWRDRRDKTLMKGEYYYYEIVNSCNYPYAVFDKEGGCIDCYSKVNFEKMFIVEISEIRRLKLLKINESR